MGTETEVEQDGRGLDRRSFIRRSAVVGAATVWVTPTVQSMVAPAFAVGTPRGGCTGCLTGGGQILTNATYLGQPVTVTLGQGQICCQGDGPTTIQVTVHTAPGSSVPFHFTTMTSIVCSQVAPVPSPPPQTEGCPNVFTGTAVDDEGNTLSFRLADHGEGNDPAAVDHATLNITNSAGQQVLAASGALERGNLQAHPALGPIERDCSGC